MYMCNSLLQSFINWLVSLVATDCNKADAFCPIILLIICPIICCLPPYETLCPYHPHSCLPPTSKAKVRQNIKYVLTTNNEKDYGTKF